MIGSDDRRAERDRDRAHDDSGGDDRVRAGVLAVGAQSRSHALSRLRRIVDWAADRRPPGHSPAKVKAYFYDPTGKKGVR